MTWKEILLLVVIIIVAIGIVRVIIHRPGDMIELIIELLMLDFVLRAIGLLFEYIANLFD